MLLTLYLLPKNCQFFDNDTEPIVLLYYVTSYRVPRLLGVARLVVLSIPSHPVPLTIFIDAHLMQVFMQ